MPDGPGDQSRESEKQILTLFKDIEHLKFVIQDQKKDQKKINDEALDAIKTIHRRYDLHLDTEVEFQEKIRDKISGELHSISKRVGALEKWKWIIFGGIVVLGTIIGKVPFLDMFR